MCKPIYERFTQLRSITKKLHTFLISDDKKISCSLIYTVEIWLLRKVKLELNFKSLYNTYECSIMKLVPSSKGKGENKIKNEDDCHGVSVKSNEQLTHYLRCNSTCHLSVESTAFIISISYKLIFITSREQRLAVFLYERPRCACVAASNWNDRHCSLLINYQAPTHTHRRGYEIHTWRNN